MRGWFGFLLAALVLLKLLGYISISWWWMAGPLVFFAFLVLLYIFLKALTD